jgi:sarcosine oxidase subunit beta
MIYDYIVIGAGIHGCTVSYQLAQTGASILLLERDQIASGASGGLGYRGVRACSRDLRELPLMARAYDLWPAVNDALGISPGYQQIGGLELLSRESLENPTLREALETRIAVQSAFGIDTALLNREELDALEPGASGLVAGAIHCPRDGVVDHTEVTRGYAAAAARLGTDISEHTLVTAITAHSNGYLVATRSGGEFRGSRVLVMANSYTRSLLHDSFGYDLPVTRFNPQMTPVRARSGFTFRHLIGHHTVPFAAKAIPDGLAMLSGGPTGSWDNATDEGHARPESAQVSMASASELFPDFIDAELISTDASRPEAKSVDGVPIIDAVPGHPSVLFATGWSGHGFAIAPATSEALTEWLVTGEKPAELAPFSVDRFAPVVRASVGPETVLHSPTQVAQTLV